MDAFQYQDGQLYCEETSLAAIAAAVGTPCYVYSETALRGRAQELLTAVAAQDTVATGTLVCYAVKANGNPALLRLLAEAGMGADVTSGGELFLALHAGFDPSKIIFSGVGKTRAEIEAALDAGIRAIHVESSMEMALVTHIANERQQPAAVGVRVNPDIAVDTHPAISTGEYSHKFGVAPSVAMTLMHQAAAHPYLQPVGLAIHLGSQITALEPFAHAADFLVSMADELAGMGIRLEYLDVGGGLGINYSAAGAPLLADWAGAATAPVLRAGYQVVMEPGRSLVGPVGALLTAVTYTKMQGQHRFVIVDAGMSDLIRPTLYDAYHPLQPVVAIGDGPLAEADVVGPICETGDWLARERPLPPLGPGDLLAVLQAGAYGFAMSSNYNGRLRPAEVLVDEKSFRLIRRRQKLEQLLVNTVSG